MFWIEDEMPLEELAEWQEHFRLKGIEHEKWRKQRELESRRSTARGRFR